MKFIPYGRQFIDKNDIKAVCDVLRSDWLTQGPKIAEFEAALCKYTGAKYAVAVSSGTAALHIACLSIAINKGDEAITSPITFAASANCVLYCGGRVHFADIEPDTANIDINQIEKQITKNTKLIIPVHYAGHPCDMIEIQRIAKKHGLRVIEDAAHALGASYKDTKTNKNNIIGGCAHSDMTIFSFHPVKHITTGEGGAVLTNNKQLYERLLLFRNHGITKDPIKFTNKAHKNDGWYYEMQELGFNYRLTDIQAALGISQLKKLDMFVKKRREIAEIYNRHFDGNGYFDTPLEKPYAKSSYHLYPIRLKPSWVAKRDKIFGCLRKNGIGVQLHYIPVYLQPFYKKVFMHATHKLSNAEYFFKSAISLPIYPAMQKKDISTVINKTLETFNEK